MPLVVSLLASDMCTATTSAGSQRSKDGRWKEKKEGESNLAEQVLCQRELGGASGEGKQQEVNREAA